MKPRRVLRGPRLMIGTAVVFAAVAAALVVPGLADATPAPPVISAPLDNAVLGAAWNRTITFTNADQTGVVSYTLYRAPALGSCAATLPPEAFAVATGVAPSTTFALVDQDSTLPPGDELTDGQWCYWLNADGVDLLSDPVEITYDGTTPAAASITSPTQAVTVRTHPTFTYAPSGGSDGNGPYSYQLWRDGANTSISSTGGTLTDSAPLTDGLPHTYVVRAVDAAGNFADSAGIDVTYDTTPPATPASLSPTGSVRMNTDPTFSYTPDSDASGAYTYKLFRGGSDTSISTTGGSLTDTATLSSGTTYTYSIHVFDVAGNETDSPDIHVAYDTTPPVAPTLTPSGSVVLNADPTFTYGTGSDGGGGYTYHLFRGGIDTGISSTTGSIADTATLTTATTYVYKVRAVDAAGNFADSATVNVIYDTTVPAAPAALSPSSAVAMHTDPTFTYTPTGDTNGAYTYKLYRNGVYTTISTTGGSLTDTASLTNGTTYTYSVRVFDVAGNETDSPDVLVTYDTTAPSVPPTPSLLSGSTPRNSPPTLVVGGSTDSLGGTVKYQLFRGSTAIGSPVVAGSVLDSGIVADGSDDGVKVYTVKAIDNAGNTSAASSVFNVQIDGTPPTTPSTAPTLVSGSTTRNSPPTFNLGGSSDTGGGTLKYQLYRDGSALGAPLVAGTFTDSSLVLTGAGDGPYHYTMRAIDPSGNLSGSSAELVITIDAGPPSVPDGLGAASLRTRTAPVISWTQSTGVPAAYSVYRDGASIGTVNFPATTFVDATLPLNGTTEGYHSYTVVAVDAAQNASAPSVALNVFVDTTRPTAVGQLTAASPTAAKPTIVWPVSTVSDVVGYDVYRGSTLLNPGTLVTGTSFTDASVTGDGAYTYTVRAVDGAGNESLDSPSVAVLFDRTGPTAPGVTASAGATGGTATVNWSAAADAGSGLAGYQVRRSAANGAAPASVADGTPVCGNLPASATVCVDAGLAAGATYHYSVFAVDGVGNVSPAGQSGAVAIPGGTDRVAPKAPTALRKAVAGSLVTLSWKNPKADVANVKVIWNALRAPRSATDGKSIYHGGGTHVSLKLQKLPAGKQVRFAVFALDHAGNASVAARLTLSVPQASPVSLAPNGRLSGSPSLTWNSVTGATYYNVQVFEGTQATKRVGISWPTTTGWKLPGSDMKKGKTYTWYVWPGIGAKASAKYGKLIGKVTFTYAG
jgi:hypothetical protein